MAESRTYYPDGKLQRLVFDNRDKELRLEIEGFIRNIANTVARVEYKEFNAAGVQTFSISVTRAQLMTLLDTYSSTFDFVYYPSGEIDTIRTRVFDASPTPIKLKDYTIKHSVGGEQPKLV